DHTGRDRFDPSKNRKVMYKYSQTKVVVNVTAANQTVTVSSDLDKSIVRITHLSAMCDKSELAWIRGTQRIEINKEEIWVEGYPTQNFIAGSNCPMEGRERPIKGGGVAAGNGNIKITFQDSDDGRTT